MASLSLKNVCKVYPNGFEAVKDFNLEIKDQEFIIFVGPSGCGKSTTLRMIAGFESPDEGEIYLGDEAINELTPNKRDTAMVFQSYALFPHYNVFDNVAYGLKLRKLPKDEIQRKVMEMLELVELSGMENRLTNQLSGGQQQRVALARALVVEPSVLLFDEPLSNLDAKLRISMRTEIRKIQQKVGITAIYVTHDQEEAMAVSDRIAVMSQGVIQHIGTPKDIYQRPANTFVATFIGRTNLFTGTLLTDGETCRIRFENGHTVEMKNIRPEMRHEQKVIISIRPEEFAVCDAGEEGMKAEVTDHIFLGLNTHYTVKIGEQEADIIQESSIDSIIPKGSIVSLKIKTDKEGWDASNPQFLVY